MKLLFNDHKQCSDDLVAGLPVYKLLDSAKSVLQPIQPTRVNTSSESFDRGALHLDSNELDEFVTLQSQFSFIALLVTTEPGVSAKRGHYIERNPLKIVLAVRRMATFAEDNAWKAFLTSSESDCIAVAEGRLEDVSDAAKPMLGFFLEKGEVLPALKILCLAFQKSQMQTSSGSTFWGSQATMARHAEWWQRVLDKAVLYTKDKCAPYQAWGDIRKAKKTNCVDAFMERLRLEANTTAKLDAIEMLVKTISESKPITLDVVDAASCELEGIRTVSS